MHVLNLGKVRVHLNPKCRKRHLVLLQNDAVKTWDLFVLAMDSPDLCRGFCRDLYTRQSADTPIALTFGLKMKLTEICLVNTWSDRFSIEGKLSLLHVNDTIHVIEYKDNERSIAVDIDLVELRSPDSTIRFTFPRGSNDKLVFKVEDESEFYILCKAKEDCQAICDLKLRLNSLLRDAYYSGVYSNLDPDAKINLNDEMDRLKRENPAVHFSALLNTQDSKPTNNSIHKVYRETSDENTVRLSEVSCVFCDSAKLMFKDLEFVLHPNVSQNSANRPVFMCGVCIENWKEFRENAEHEGQLVLPGEVNEEICAVCSDTPESLVLCGECPRSFCQNCLQHLLSPSELQEVNKSDDDWVCVCCVSGQSRNPPLARTAWKMVMPGTGKRGYAHGTLVPYSKSKQARPIQPVEPTLLPSAPQPTGAIPPSLAALATGAGASRTAAAARSTSANGSKYEEVTPEPKKSSRTAATMRKASYDEDEVDPLASLQAANKNAASSNNRGKRMEKRQRDLSGTAVSPELDEKYYFGQYVGYYNLLCEDVAQRRAAAEIAGVSTKGKGKRKSQEDEVPTDDVCFLCKDGGDLIECDWRCGSSKGGERCLKVYHTYCLDFEVAENDEKWCCPRHYCDMCGIQTLKYICKYCPVSICANCPRKIVGKYGHARYCEVTDVLSGAWCHTPTSANAKTIVCHTCTEMLEVISSTASTTSVEGSASIEVMLRELRVQKCFPGQYEGESSGGGSVFRKEASNTSDDRSLLSEPFHFSKGKAIPVKGKTSGASAASGRVAPSVASATTAVSTVSTVSSSNKPKAATGGAKFAYRRWSDAETSVLRAAVRVHGDNAEAIKADPKFAEPLQFRNAEAIWNKILREALLPSVGNSADNSVIDHNEATPGDEEEEEAEFEEELQQQRKEQDANIGKNEGLVVEESAAENQEVNGGKACDTARLMEHEPSDMDVGGGDVGLQNEDTPIVDDVPTEDAVPSAVESLHSTATVDVATNIDSTGQPVSTNTDVVAAAAVAPSMDEVSVEVLPPSASLPDEEGEEKQRECGEVEVSRASSPASTRAARSRSRSTTQSPAARSLCDDAGAVISGPIAASTSTSRSSSRLSIPAAETFVATEKVKPGRGKHIRTPKGTDHTDKASSKPTELHSDGICTDGVATKEDEIADGVEAETAAEAPRMVATRTARRAVEEQKEQNVLSTRSGKKLFLSGSDLLPSFH